MKLCAKKSGIPSSSRELLKQFLGSKVIALVRYSWWAKEDIAATTGVGKPESFSLTAGPLAVQFEDGSILGVSSDPGTNSVVVWLDRFIGQVDTTQTLNEDSELFAIQANDKAHSMPYWAHFLGRTLCGFSIIKITDMNAKQASLPSERGLCFHFGAGDRFIAAHGLHDGSDDFSVIVDAQIDAGVREHLEELALF
ncbi:MAG: hypothetical protein EOO28_22065 [Comamonadaceae bacterium]|nr:MAG: hypothetical protein EOO28_22065 [Comamonadaceae bacterium]